MTRTQLNRVLRICLDEEVHPNRVFRLLGGEAFEAHNMALNDADLIEVVREYLEAYGVTHLGMTRPR